MTTSLTDRFNPEPDSDYGYCLVCGKTLPAEADADAHMTETLEASRVKGESRGHRIRISNPSRARRLELEVDGIVDRAIASAMDELDALVTRNHATEDEIAQAVRQNDGFAEAWGEYTNE